MYMLCMVSCMKFWFVDVNLVKYKILYITNYINMHIIALNDMYKNLLNTYL